ncbi:MAG: radical SAM protein [Candidatus Pacebacteria bacterium]|nr:radical SAM protein [Candidatus Paceibacterota bacterium]
MKKIILINPAFNIVKSKYDTSLSVGLLCLASYLYKRNFPVKIVDCARQGNWQETLDKELSQTGYVGLSVMTSQVPSAIEIAKKIRKAYPKIKLIWGGPHVTFFPKEVLESDLSDFIVLNEGEKTLWELLQELEKNSGDFSKIRGLGYKSSGKIFINPPRELLPMEEIPLPNWELVPKEILERLEMVPTHTSRGCPHRCAFCINAITKNRWRMRSSEQVLSDISIIESKPFFTGKKLRFWDENFFVDLRRVAEIVDGMISKKLIVPWETTIRADYFSLPDLTDEFLAKLKKSGCYLLSFGAESGSIKILRKIDKDITREQILNSARRCLKYGIIPQYSFMVGLPGESREDMNQTISLIDELLKLDARVQILGPQAFRPYPGSPLYEECLLSGWKAPAGLEDWSNAILNEMSYLTPYQFPWVKDPDMVDSLEAYARFGAQSFKSALGSTVTSNKFLKFLFSLVCRLRWKLRFFKWPIEYKLAKKYVAK